MDLERLRNLPVYRYHARILGEHHEITTLLRWEIGHNSVHVHNAPDFLTSECLVDCLVFARTLQGEDYWWHAFYYVRDLYPYHFL